MKFEEFSLKKEILEQVEQLGFFEATPIQKKCIPAILQGKDVVGQSLTGSGKTAAFGLPIINQLEKGKNGQLLVLTPTRELAQQVKEAIDSFGKILGIRAVSIYGGVGFGTQIRGIQNSEIIVATPGRLIDHLNRRSFNLKNVRFVVLDEVDRMLDIGFEKDVNEILRQVPKERQTVMFSATMPMAAKKIAHKYLNNPIHLQAELKVDTSLLKQIVYNVPRERRFSLLTYLLKEKKGTALVFCRTKRDVDKIAKNLRKHGLIIGSVHGDITQNQRQRAVTDFKENKLDALIATDVASRGLDIKNVTHVYNYEVPSESDDYIHRIGRTARAGKKGDAITFVTERDKRMFNEIKRTNQITVEELPDFPQIIFEKTQQHDRRHNRRNFDSKKFDSNKPWKKRFNENNHKQKFGEKNYREETSEQTQNKKDYYKSEQTKKPYKKFWKKNKNKRW
ncbi:MAG: DEAD/DEAH box helicase [Candidatus ainarchaeum sp.]|nr:DEAD/DEAH box helicase [Candidatus ainarchaeum sp.]